MAGPAGARPMADLPDDVIEAIGTRVDGGHYVVGVVTAEGPRYYSYVPSSPGESFPERLKTYRMLKGLTQRQLAAELSVDPTTVRKWEAGTSNPRPETRERVEQLIEGD